MTSVSSRSVMPEILRPISAGRCADSHRFQNSCRAACSVICVKAGARRASRSLTESAFSETGLVLLLIGGFPRLSRLIFFGIFLRLLEQTLRKVGTQSHRSKARSYDSGVVSIVQAFQSKTGPVRSGHGPCALAGVACPRGIAGS